MRRAQSLPKLESAVCDRCGSASERALFEGPDRLHNLPGTFRVVECLQCGWLRQNPRPTQQDMGFYYPADYINYIGAVEDEPTRWRQWDRRYEFVKRRRAIEHLQPRGRLLDVGCATGLFLHEMQQAGWEVVGVEPNLGAARYAQERFALPVEIGTLRNVRLTDESFDVVTLWDVLEHLHTPWQDLVQVRRLLKNNGLLVLSLPNLESLERRWFGPTWLGWDLPRHLYSFPRPALVSALAELGFHVEQIRCIAGSYHAWLLSLRFHWQERYPQARWPKPALSALRCLPARFAAAPLFWAIGQARLASVITYFARRGGESSARSPSLSLPGEARG